jgi:hypothetical protein
MDLPLSLKATTDGDTVTSILTALLGACSDCTGIRPQPVRRVIAHPRDQPCQPGRGAGNNGPVSTARASSFLNAAGTMGG